MDDTCAVLSCATRNNTIAWKSPDKTIKKRHTPMDIVEQHNALRTCPLCTNRQYGRDE